MREAGRAVIHDYRPEIDGLRTIAVVPVVLFHLNLPIFSGGYIGVDVFFVISGFLITSVIRREIERGRFSIVIFYERRARRILPALFATMILVLVAGYIVFMPDDLRDTGASAFAAAVFASNILFWLQIDYFNSATELKPLIHTWSLAVEEQFYIVFPLLLMGLARLGSRRPAVWTLLLAILSFALSVAMLRLAPEANYYLLPSRAWELLIGSLLALGALPALRRGLIAEATALLGLGAIAGSALLLTADSPFPGYNALWPCLGAAAVIHASARHATLVGRVLNLRPFVAVGLISYSLYLVHWPLIVVTKYVLLRPLDPFEALALFAAMLALAGLMWRFVERPFRDRQRVDRGTVFAVSGGGLAAIGAAGLAVFLAAGLPGRYPGLARAAIVDAADARPDGRACFLRAGYDRWAGDRCFLSSRGGPIVLLWGDSHANHYRQSIAGHDAEIDKSILFYGSAGCLPLLDQPISGRPHCVANNAHALEIIADYGIREVILAGYWYYTMAKNGIGLDQIVRTVARLRERGVEVKVVGNGPDFSFANPEFLAYRLRRRSQPDADFYLGVRNPPRFNDRLRQALGATAFFDPMAVLCRDTECLTYRTGRLVMSDNAHLSKFGADLVMDRMAAFISR